MPSLSVVLHLLGASPAWHGATASHPLPNTLPGWAIAFLALQGDWVSRERLLALLWPDAAAAEAQHNLRATLHRARGLLADWSMDDALLSERRRVRLSLPTDAAALRRAAAHATGPLPIYPGPLLASMGFDGFPVLREWAELESGALAALWRDAVLARLGRVDSCAPEAVTLAQQLLDTDPLDEGALLHLLRCLRAQGRGPDADRHYEQYRQRLARELGVEPSPALRALASSTLVAAAAPAPGAHAFVGRRLELAELERRLASRAVRLHTLVGPGGIGKSSLARQALVRSELPSAWIDLQDLMQIDSVSARIAQRLGFDLRDSLDAPAQIAQALGPAPRVLALDNAEHLFDLTGFARRLLDAAPALTLLVTSRRPLGAEGELLLALDGLAVPDEDSRDAEAAAAFDAVQLFTLRAQTARSDFELAPHVAAVTTIVDAVGGLPLAIELAASWVRLLPPEAIAHDLRGTLDLLERDPAAAGIPARPEHASVRAVLDRSWALLAAREREALEALSVFEGGFTRSAAAAVGGVALPLLSSLVDKALLKVDEQGRFGLHPLVASDAARRLASQPPRRAELRDRHAAYWSTTLEESLAASATDPRVIVASVNADYANAVAAWAHAVAACRHDDVQRLTAVWRVVFDTQGRYGEGARLLEVALGLPLSDRAAERSVAAVRGALSMLLFRRQNLGSAIAVAEAGIALAERCGERRALVACLFSAGSAYSIQGHWQRSLPLFERALAVAREDNERSEIAVALLNVGICAKKDGRADDALTYYRQSLAIERELGRHVAAVRCLNNIGVLYMERGDWEHTREHMAEGLRLCRQYGIASLAPYLETGLGQALYELGRFDDAERHLAHVRVSVPAAELPVVHMNVTINLGRVALRRGRVDQARPYFFAGAQLALASETEADQLDFAMYWGEWLRDSGRVQEAARTWLAVIDDPRAEAGVRQGCEEGLATLKLEPAARAAARAAAPSLDTLKFEWAALPPPQ